MKVSIRRGLCKTKILFMWGIFYLLSSLYAQTHDVQFHRLSLEDGLSQNSVYCIFQDSQGFMWFGTQDGLNRYDSNKDSFSSSKNNLEYKNSLGQMPINCLFEDRSGKLIYLSFALIGELE